MKEQYLLQVHNLSVKLSKKVIFHNICMDIEKGDFAVLLGNNGSGKTVLLNTLMGFTKFHMGTISSIENLCLAYVPQEIHFNIHIPLLVSDFLQLKRKPPLEDIYSELGIQSLLAFSMKELSGGELQKVLLAHALSKNPHLIILDEPEKNLDLESQINLYKILKTINKDRRISILLVSHHLHFALPVANKIYCMYNGRMIAQGNKEKVFKTKEFMDNFSESIEYVFSAYHKVDGHQHN